MALIVKTPQDVRKYETKQLGPFTFKQAIWLTIATILTLPVFIFVPVRFSTKVLICTAIAAPIGACGFINPNHTPMETWLLRGLYRTVLTPARRKKKNEISIKARRLNPPIEKPKYSRKPDHRIYC